MKQGKLWLVEMSLMAVLIKVLKLGFVQIWKQRLQNLGGVVEEHQSKRLTHIFGASMETVIERLGGPKKLKTNMVSEPLSVVLEINP